MQITGTRAHRLPVLSCDGKPVDPKDNERGRGRQPGDKHIVADRNGYGKT